jgi:HK97 family phage prohead protease
MTTAPLGSYLWKAAAVDQLTETGTFRAYLSTWDVDSDNERFAKGAYTRSIFEYVSAGVMPAVVWQHDTVRSGGTRQRAFDQENVVGRVTSMKEDHRGLLITGKVNLDTERGKLIYGAMKEGKLAMSVGFVAHEWRMDGDVKTFTQAEILEATLTPNPANPNAVILEVKRHQPAPSSLARENSRLRAKLALIEAKKGAERDRLVEIANRNSAEALRAVTTRQYTLGELIELERLEEQRRYERDVAEVERRDAERAEQRARQEAFEHESRDVLREEFGIGEVNA